MRSASRAPRNSRELAVRNQFFTPRYVVEFLTDNTLGRMWYEMRQGDTRLIDQCRYLVRRPNEVFLQADEEAPPAPKDTADLSQEQLLGQPAYIAHRAKKDPRDIRILDPACGSGHFLLYAFDSLNTIYEEAWADPEMPFFEGTDTRLADDYPDLDTLRRAIPGLILRHNLHGIDIDSRAVQIAAVALWLRVQRSYQELGLAPAQRPRITKTNLVTAEPMPGDRSLLDEFVATLSPPVVGDLMRVVFDKMQLAGEAGSLLKIEDELIDAIAKAKRQWKESKKLQPALLPEPLRPEEKQGSLFDVSGIGNEAFWGSVEGLVLKALREYSTQADTRRRLFAEDAARGFAFIDICGQLYEVVLMNPPFGDGSLPSKAYIEDNFSDSKGDIFTTFVERFQDRLISAGFLGIISSRTGFFLGTATDWRERVVLRLYRPLLLADLGEGVMDATVEAAAYVLRRITEEEDLNLTLQILPHLLEVETDRSGYFSIPKYQQQRGDLKRQQAVQELDRLLQSGYIGLIEGHYPRFKPKYSLVQNAPAPKETAYPPLVCVRLLTEENKEAALLEVLSRNSKDYRCFVVAPEQFREYAGSPFVYWVSKYTIGRLANNPLLEDSYGVVRVGLQTGNDTRFLRLIWEVPAEAIGSFPAQEQLRSTNTVRSIRSQFEDDKRWAFYSRTDYAAPWVSPFTLVVDWKHDGELLKAYVRTRGYSASKWVQSESLYFRAGFSYLVRSTRVIPFIVPADVIPMAVRSQVFPHKGREVELLGYCASNIATAVARFGGGKFLWPMFQASLIQNLPVPNFSAEIISDIAALVDREVAMRRTVIQGHEPYQDFTHPATLNACRGVATSWDLLSLLGQHLESEIAEAFGLSETQLGELERDINEAVTVRTRSKSKVNDGEDENDETIADEATTVEFVDESPYSNTEGLISYSVGCAFGRWDVRMGLDTSLAPKLQGVFDPLPLCPRGSLLKPDGLPAMSDQIASEAWLRARPDAITLPPKGSLEGPATISDYEYPIRIAWDGVLVDDPGLNDHDEPHSSDIVSRTRQVLAILWPGNHDATEADACGILGVRELRDYFRNPNKFFADHLKRYSKSRRQAPIYWPLSTTSGRYTLWLYYHRLTDQTLYAAVNDYVDPKIRRVEDRVARLEAEIGQATGGAASQVRDRLDDARPYLAELREFREELLRVAELPYKPNLNDGVIMNAAPLHKLFGLRRWARDTEKVWKKLEGGDYDWAHMAFALWPDRVREICKRDRSIAITHGLEELCEVEPKEKGKAKKKVKS